MTATATSTESKPYNTVETALASLAKQHDTITDEVKPSMQLSYVEMAQAHAKQPPRYSN